MNLGTVEVAIPQVVYRVLDEDGTPRGTAFLVHRKLLLTCAHVVALAQTYGDSYSTYDMNRQVLVELPSEPGVRFKTNVVKYVTMTDYARPDRDIAFLELPDYSDESPLVWCTDTPTVGLAVKSFGFQQALTLGGGWSYGEIADQDALGWWQVQGSSQMGVPFKPGLSGSPVFNKESGALVGMLAAAHPSETLKYAFLISFDAINRSCPENGFMAIQPPDMESLWDTFLKFDYTAQVNQFRKFANTPCPAKAFLIHGDYNYGQRIFANRLVNAMGLEKSDVIPVAYGLVQNPSLATIHADIAGFLRRRPADMNANLLVNKLRSKHVVIRLQIGGLVKSASMDILLNEFWTPLAQTVAAANSQKRLLLLIIDEGGMRREWDLPLWDQPQRNPYDLIELPPLQKFNAELLIQFIEDHLQFLSLSLGPRLDSVCHRLIAECEDGVPEEVFSALCDFFGISWHNKLVKEKLR